MKHIAVWFSVLGLAFLALTSLGPVVRPVVTFPRDTTFHAWTGQENNVEMYAGSVPFGQTISAVFADTSYTLGFMVTGNIYDDSGMGYVYGHRATPKILFPKTDAGRVLLTGQLTWSGYTHLVTVGGRGANPTTRYYEDNGLAPLKWGGTATNAIIVNATGVAKLNVPLSSLGSGNDYFTMQVIVDGSHKVVILWGITQYGTFTSGVYFDGIYPNMNTLTEGWYIVRWEDLNGDGIPDYPGEFTIHASGT